MAHLSTRAWGVKQQAASSKQARWPASAIQEEPRQGAHNLARGAADAAVSIPPVSPLPGLACALPLAAHKPDNRTSRAAAGDQLVWHPWPLRHGVRDHRGRDRLPPAANPFAAAYRDPRDGCHAVQSGSGSPHYLIQRHEWMLCLHTFMGELGASCSHPPQSKAFGWSSELGLPEQETLEHRVPEHEPSHLPWTSPASALNGRQGMRQRGILLEGSPQRSTTAWPGRSAFPGSTDNAGRTSRLTMDQTVYASSDNAGRADGRAWEHDSMTEESYRGGYAQRI